MRPRNLRASFLIARARSRVRARDCEERACIIAASLTLTRARSSASDGVVADWLLWSEQFPARGGGRGSLSGLR